jgi:dCTP deaminase
MFLHKSQILSLIEKENDPLVIRPLLDQNQLGEVSIDFRLGYDFMVAIHGRNAGMELQKNIEQVPMQSFFQPTRRKPGETFLLHPQQTVLAVSLEYIKLPANVFMTLSTRSSYSRLGLSISGILQPGYCGCIPLELTNGNHTPVNLTVGARIFQAQVFEIAEESDYFATQRKYVCQVRPEVSAALADKDLDILNHIWKKNNFRS